MVWHSLKLDTEWENKLTYGSVLPATNAQDLLLPSCCLNLPHPSLQEATSRHNHNFPKGFHFLHPQPDTTHNSTHPKLHTNEHGYATILTNTNNEQYKQVYKVTLPNS